MIHQRGITIFWWIALALRYKHNNHFKNIKQFYSDWGSVTVVVLVAVVMWRLQRNTQQHPPPQKTPAAHTRITRPAPGPRHGFHLTGGVIWMLKRPAFTMDTEQFLVIVLEEFKERSWNSGHLTWPLTCAQILVSGLLIDTDLFTCVASLKYNIIGDIFGYRCFSSMIPHHTWRHIFR